MKAGNHPGSRDLLGLARNIRVLAEGRWKPYLLLLAAMMVAAVFELLGLAAVPIFVAVLLDPGHLERWLPGQVTVHTGSVPTIITAAAGLALLYVVKNLYLVGVRIMEARLLRDLTIKVQERLFSCYVRAPYSFHLQRNPAESIRNINSAVNDAVQLVRNALSLFREMLVVGVIAVLLLVVDPIITALLFALLGLSAAAFHFIVRRSLHLRGEQSQASYSSQLQVMSESLGAIKEIRVLGREGHAISRFRAMTELVWSTAFFHTVVAGLPRLFLETVAVSVVLLVAAAFVALGREAQTILPVLSLLAISVIRMIPSFNVITTAASNIQYYRPGLDLVSADLTTLDAAEAQVTREPRGQVPPLQHVLSLDAISFRYPGVSTDTVVEVTLRIRTGESVGITGTTGAGKSTLVDIILGLIEPDRGAVLVDGHDIRGDPRGWQRQIGYVPQDIYLLDDTITRNVAFGLDDDEIDHDAVERAIRTAHLIDFVGGLPQGLETTVGNRGVRLSGGQRQRIGIARALYKNPAVLVMDEATAALDDDTEREVIAAIRHLRGDRTLIVIAHRSTILDNCERVVRLEAGRVVTSK